jgi:predicted nucleic acid-binding protein
VGLVLDTNIFIAAERTNTPFDFNQWQDYGAVFISAITASELLAGVHMAASEKIRLRRSQFVEKILQRMPILDFTVQTARIHAKLYANLYQSGQMIGAHDLLIAATALANDCAVLTTNGGEFRRAGWLCWNRKLSL